MIRPAKNEVVRCAFHLRPRVASAQSARRYQMPAATQAARMSSGKGPNCQSSSAVCKLK